MTSTMMGLLINVMGLILSVAMAAAGEAPMSKHDCPHRCGDVDIPYPFGVGDNCSLNTFFNLTCYHSNSTLYYRQSNIQVLNISIDGHHMDISAYVSQICFNQLGQDIDHSFISSLTIAAFSISSEANKFVTVGCDSYGYLNSYQGGQLYSTGCLSKCDKLPPTANSTASGDETCSGIGCCQIDIPPQMRDITLEAYSFHNHTEVSGFNNCTYAFVAKQGSFNFSQRDLQSLPFNRSHIVLDWSIVDVDNITEVPSPPKHVSCSRNAYHQNSSDAFGYICFCKPGFHGNPYLLDGCLDVDECHAHTNECDVKAHALCNSFDGGYNCSCPPGYKGDGYVNGTSCTLDTLLHSNSHLLPLTIALGVCLTLFVGLTLVSTLCWVRKQRTLTQFRQWNFEQTGGNLQLQRLSQQQGYADGTNIFTQAELQNAANNFHEDRACLDKRWQK